VSVVGAKQVKRKPASSAAKPEALPLVPEKVLTPAEFATPPAELLRPFRAAAKENQKRLREKVKAKRRSTTFLAKGPKKGKKYVADLRVHSPGTIGYFAPGGVDPAQALVRLAKVKGLHMIGLTDYYNAEYVDCVKGFAQGTSVSILPGFDFCCMVGLCAEVHMSALFPEETTSAQIFSVLQELKVPATAQGDSSFVLTTDFEVVLETIEKHGGILIPSRVDKTPYRQLALKTLIEQYGFHAFDLVHPESPDIFREHWPNGEFTFFSFSNANALGQVGNRVSKVKLEAPTFEFLKSRIARRTIH
jgi:PHP family Zn ribbon phosphoesterase